MNAEFVQLPSAESLEDNLLLNRVRIGDQQACRELVNAHGSAMLACARRFLRNDEDSEDAVQDAFVAAFRAINSFNGQSRLSTWLHRIVVNQCLMRLRSRKHRRPSSIDELLPLFDATGHHVRRIKPWITQPEERLQRDEVRAQVRKQIDCLPDDYRTILLMRDVDGLDTQETASILGITIALTKTRLHRARQALRTLLEPIFADK